MSMQLTGLISWIVVLFVLYYIILYPLDTVMRQKSDEIVTLQKQNSAFEATLHQLSAEASGHEALLREYKELSQEPFFLIDSLSAFLAHAHTHNLEHTGLLHCASQQKEYYKREDYQLTFTGDFEDVELFLKDAQVNLCPHKIRECVMEKMNDKIELNLICSFYEVMCLSE